VWNILGAMQNGRLDEFVDNFLRIENFESFDIFIFCNAGIHEWVEFSAVSAIVSR